MAKYSTGSSNNNRDPKDDDASCTLCGTTDSSLELGKVAGATVLLCKSCNPEQDEEKQNQKTKSKQRRKSQTNKRRDKPGGYTITNPDSSWVEKDRPDYGNVKTPYMLRDYDKILYEARNRKDLSQEELAESVEISVEDIVSLENRNAIDKNVSEKAINRIEDFLNITLTEQI